MSCIKAGVFQSFRNEHGAFLRRIAELKARIDAL